MSDKFVDKKENNLTQVDFKVKKKLEFPEEFISIVFTSRTGLLQADISMSWINYFSCNRASE